MPKMVELLYLKFDSNYFILFYSIDFKFKPELVSKEIFGHNRSKS